MPPIKSSTIVSSYCHGSTDNPMRQNVTTEFVLRLKREVRGEVKTLEPMSKHTSWRVGGEAELWISPADLDDLVHTMALLDESGVPWTILGKGSNTLVSDNGISGAVIHIESGFTWMHHTAAGSSPDAVSLVVGAGTPIAALLRYATQHGLGGIERLVGIPGTVGGAVRMNAGTHLGEIKDILVSVKLLRSNRTLVEIDATGLGLTYRHSAITPGEIVVEATLALTKTDPEQLRMLLRDTKERRQKSQPLTLPSGGSTFANPPGDKAWRLIDAAGLRGVRIGGAQISELHPNFIVNLGDATANDIDALIQLVQKTVEKRFGVKLRPEICRLGDWEPQETANI